MENRNIPDSAAASDGCMRGVCVPRVRVGMSPFRNEDKAFCKEKPKKQTSFVNQEICTIMYVVFSSSLKCIYFHPKRNKVQNIPSTFLCSSETVTDFPRCIYYSMSELESKELHLLTLL